MFSATLSEESATAARKLVRKRSFPCVEVLLEDGKVSLVGIAQYKIGLTRTSSAVDVDQLKLEVLNDIYHQITVSKCIIFTNTRKRAEWVGQQLKQENHSVSILHGDLSKRKNLCRKSIS